MPTPTPSILAVDPGFTQSAYVVYQQGRILDQGIVPNSVLLNHLSMGTFHGSPRWMYCEMIASYGMPVGKEVFETCVWIGRFIQAWPHPVSLIYRKDVKIGLCGSTKANDATIRQAILDRFGPGREIAIGTKKCPGPLYSIKKDLWAALAIAVHVTS